MRGPSHGLCAIPTGERVCREPRVDESEMRRKHDVVQVVVVIVDLGRRELALVNDVFAREGTDVEPLGERTEERMIISIQVYRVDNT